MTTIHRGSRGQAVTEVQSALGRHGHEVATDGRFGRETAAAVRAFQREHHLRADGVVGRRTAEALGLHADSFDAAGAGGARRGRGRAEAAGDAETARGGGRADARRRAEASRQADTYGDADAHRAETAHGGGVAHGRRAEAAHRAAADAHEHADARRADPAEAPRRGSAHHTATTRPEGSRPARRPSEVDPLPSPVEPQPPSAEEIPRDSLLGRAERMHHLAQQLQTLHARGGRASTELEASLQAVARQNPAFEPGTQMAIGGARMQYMQARAELIEASRAAGARVE